MSIWASIGNDRPEVRATSVQDIADEPSVDDVCVDVAYASGGWPHPVRLAFYSSDEEVYMSAADARVIAARLVVAAERAER